MGRIKTQQTKRTVKTLLKKFPGEFSTDFEKNKKIVGEKAEIQSKKLRNVIAGSLTRQVKSNKD